VRSKKNDGRDRTAEKWWSVRVDGRREDSVAVAISESTMAVSADASDTASARQTRPNTLSSPRTHARTVTTTIAEQKM